MTPKQKRFVQEYLVDLNATRAAVRARYSPRTAKSQGQRLLTNVDVARAIQEALEERTARTHVTQDRVIKDLAAIAFSDPRELFNADGRLKSVSEMDDDAASALASLETTELTDTTARVNKVKLSDKLKALELLGRHLGMFNDRLRTGGSDDASLRVELVKSGNAVDADRADGH